MTLVPDEHPELWDFLNARRAGEVLSGTVAAIERFGVFVALDDGPGHPLFPGVGFVSAAELSWERFASFEDVVRVGQRVSCEFLQFDTYNGEARLSLKAMEPDPLRAFAAHVACGRELRGEVTELIPFGVFVRVADGVEGLVHIDDLAPAPGAVLQDVVAVGDRMTVVVTDVDLVRRRVRLSPVRPDPDPPDTP